MKIAFRTIQIENLVLCYLLIFGSCLALHFIWDLFVPAYFFLLLPVVLYFLFRGKVEITLCEQHLKIFWKQKPLLGKVQNQSIDLNEIIRWQYSHNFRGPDNLTVILKSGEKIRIRPDLFQFKDVETPLLESLKEKIIAEGENGSGKILLQKIRNSNYFKGLEQKILILKWLLKLALFAALICLITAAFYSETNLIWISFLISFCCCFLFFLWHSYLKSERNKALNLK